MAAIIGATRRSSARQGGDYQELIAGALPCSGEYLSGGLT
jgi:hypothetical protein